MNDLRFVFATYYVTNPKYTSEEKIDKKTHLFGIDNEPCVPLQHMNDIIV